MKRNFLAGLMTLFVIAFGFVLSVNGQTQKAKFTPGQPAVQQPLYSEFKGARLGMTADEVRAKLGTPVLKDDELDYFVFSDTVTAQVAYDKAHKAKAISVDYASGAGAPESASVVGGPLETRPDGSMYKIVRYEAQGFWVSYNRTAGPVVVVTITIQRMMN